MGVSEAVILAPVAVTIGRAFVQRGVLIAEDEADVDVGVLFFDEQVFLPIINSPATLSFDKEKAALFWQLKIRCVFGCSFRPDVFDFVFLVADW